MEAMYLTDLEHATEVVLSGRAVRSTAPRTHARAAWRRARWARHTGRTRRAAAAGALRLSRTFGDALTARRPLGAAEAWTLLYGTLVMGATGFIAFKWPKAFAYPLGGFLLWVAVIWVIQAVTLLWRGRRAPSAVAKLTSRREDAA
jgi:cardiolipin synthase